MVDKRFAVTKIGHIPTVLGLMIDDVIFMVPSQPPFGKKEFAAASEGMKNHQIDGTYDIQEVQVLGNWDYLRNHIRMTVTPSDGSPPCTAPAIPSPSCARPPTAVGEANLLAAETAATL